MCTPPSGTATSCWGREGGREGTEPPKLKSTRLYASACLVRHALVVLAARMASTLQQPVAPIVSCHTKVRDGASCTHPRRDPRVTRALLSMTGDHALQAA